MEKEPKSGGGTVSLRGKIRNINTSSLGPVTGGKRGEMDV